MPKPPFKFLKITAILFGGVQIFQIFGLNNNYSQEDTIHTAYIHKIMWRIQTKANSVFGSSPQNIIKYLQNINMAY